MLNVPREQRRIVNVPNDEEGEDDQGNNGVFIKDMHILMSNKI